MASEWIRRFVAVRAGCATACSHLGKASGEAPHLGDAEIVSFLAVVDARVGLGGVT